MNSMELEVAEPKNISSWKDSVGIVASIGCAIHCAAMPFVIAYLPAWGLSFLADEAFHKWVALICFLIAIAAFLPGLRKHGNWLPVGVGSVGLIFITFAAFGLAGECCPSCAAAANTSVANADIDSNPSLCEAECEHCESCTSCESNGQVETASFETASLVNDASAPEGEGLLSQLAPWITPFGGMLLVVAHLMNRRFGCLCGCCGSETDALSVSTS